MINPRAITVSRILEHIRRGKVLSVHSIREGFGEIIEVEVNEKSNLIGTTIGEFTEPSKMIVGAVWREGKVLVPHQDLAIQNDDRMVMMVSSNSIPKIEKLISEQLSYF